MLEDFASKAGDVSSFIFFIALVSCVLGGLVFLAVSRWWKQRRFLRRCRRGVQAEAQAGPILKSYGYELLETQKQVQATINVDGKALAYQVCPDGLAKRGNSLFAVEVKTGRTAPKPLYRETRRQLLEYYHILPVEGVLLVNADLRTVSVVSFEKKSRKTKEKRFLLQFVIAQLCIFALLSFFFHYFGLKSWF